MLDFAKIAKFSTGKPQTAAAKPKVLIVDGNWLLQKFYHAKGHVYGSDLLNSTDSLASSLKTDKTLFLFDSGKSQYRTSLLSAYKGNRKPKDGDMSQAFHNAREWIKNKVSDDLQIWMEKDTEADDLAAYLVNNFSKDNVLFLYSIDHDWLQLLRENVYQVRHDVKTSRDLVYSEKTASQLLGYPSRKWPLLAAFTGDPSDNVPSSGITSTTALKWLEKYAWSLPKIFQMEAKAKTKEALIWRNYRLTKLTGNCVEPDQTTVKMLKKFFD